MRRLLAATFLCFSLGAAVAGAVDKDGGFGNDTVSGSGGADRLDGGSAAIA